MNHQVRLNLEQLRRLLNPTYLSRGIAYADKGAVFDIQVTDQEHHLQARVLGKGRNVYHCDIWLEGSAHQVENIEGYCSCPMRFNCKHVAAVLYQHIKAQELLQGKDSTVVSPSVQTWLQSLSMQFVEKKTRVQKHELHYLISIPKQIYLRHLHVEVVKTIRLKNGGWGKQTRFTTGSSSKAGFVSSKDLEILHLLESTQTYVDFSMQGYSLSQTGSGIVLDNIVTTGRCHWQVLKNPVLTTGDTLQGDLGWQASKDTNLRVCIDSPDADGLLLLPCVPLWYVDPKQHKLGRFDCDMEESIALALVTAPDIPPEYTEQVVTQLKKTFPKKSLPLPQEKILALRTDINPVPHLTLFSQKDPYYQAGAEYEEYALMYFSYAGHEVAPDDESLVLSWKSKDGELEQVQRNTDKESTLFQQIQEWEFYKDNYDNHTNTGLRLYLEDKEDWVAFSLEGIESLSQQGWQIAFDNSWRLQVLEADAWYADLEDDAGSSWFDLELGVQVEGKKISLLPLLIKFIARMKRVGSMEDFLTAEDNLPLLMPLPATDKEQYLKLPYSKVKHIIQTLVELYDPKSLNQDGRLRMSRFQADQLNTLKTANLTWGGDAAPVKFAQRLKDFQGIKPIAIPKTLKAELRPYQQQGLDWLQFLRKYDLAGILADDMGLGKTVQALAHLLKEKSAGRAKHPNLVVATTSLMVNWANEAARFAPSLRTLVLQGSERKQHFDNIRDYDLVLTTYPLLPRDSEILLAQQWHLVILDEAQHIKNPRSKVAQAAQDLRANHRLCLTGTPMENHLGELWSQFNFLMPGLLGDEKQFRKLFRLPIEKEGDQQRQQQLNQRLLPFMLRREKSEVAKELPEKTEIMSVVELSGKQRQLYETIRVAMNKRVREEIDKKGIERSQIIILDALLKLRQVCCDPRLLKMETAKKVKNSAKLDQLMDMLPEMIAEGRRILLFSQFTSMLALIETELDKLKIPFVKLTGQTRDRATPINEFQNKKVPLFLISLKAGGAGLNLTAADTVIHYDPWWNPAVERQATDRAHRIGQENKVFVYKLVAKGTVEEKINALQQKKQALADALFDGSKQSTKLDRTDLQALFEPLR